MAKQETPVQRVQKAFPRLSQVATTLNEKSDKLGASIAFLESKLKKLNLGVTSWVEFASERGDDWSYQEEIGYARINGKWGISIRTVSHDYGSDPEPQFQEWQFNDAARSLRLQAVKKIPELLEQLVEDANELAKTIDEESAHVATIADAIDEEAW